MGHRGRIHDHHLYTQGILLVHSHLKHSVPTKMDFLEETQAPLPSPDPKYKRGSEIMVILLKWSKNEGNYYFLISRNEGNYDVT